MQQCYLIFHTRPISSQRLEDVGCLGGSQVETISMGRTLNLVSTLSFV